MTDRRSSVSDDLAAAVARLQRVLERAENTEIDPGLLHAIDGSLAVAQRNVRRLAHHVRRGRMTVRAQVIEALTDLGVPASMSQISAYHQAVFESNLTPKAMASLRRDESRRDATREVVVVGTLTPQLRPARGRLALSTWPAWLRITGVYSERVDRLYAVRCLLNRLDSLLASDHSRRDAIVVALRDFGLAGITANGIDIPAARVAVASQLALIEDSDRRERDAAAARAPAL